MAEIKAVGTVIEARPNQLIIRRGIRPVEELYQGLTHDAAPGMKVRIYDDGNVEVFGDAVRPFEVVRTIEVPTTADGPQPDHS